MRICLRRREFVAGLGGVASWPLTARAQRGDRVRRIGVLMPGDEKNTLHFAFIQSLGLDRWPQRADRASLGRR